MEVTPTDTTMVLESARKHLKQLAPLGAELNRTSDAFTEELKAIEAELAKLNLGIEVELDVPLMSDPELDDPDTGEPKGTFYRAYYLGYGRTPSGWGLLVKTYRHERDPRRFDGSPGSDEYSVLEGGQRLVECSRELRMAAAEQIEELLTKLKQTATEKLAALQKVTDSK